MSTDEVQTNIRLPADLKRRLVEAASDSNRSLSGEIAHRLDRSFAEADGGDLALRRLAVLLAKAENRAAMMAVFYEMQVLELAYLSQEVIEMLDTATRLGFTALVDQENAQEVRVIAQNALAHVASRQVTPDVDELATQSEQKIRKLLQAEHELDNPGSQGKPSVNVYFDHSTLADRANYLRSKIRTLSQPAEGNPKGVRIDAPPSKP